MVISLVFLGWFSAFSVSEAWTSRFRNPRNSLLPAIKHAFVGFPISPLAASLDDSDEAASGLPPLPTPTPWNDNKLEALLRLFDCLMVDENGNPSAINRTLQDALDTVTNPLWTKDPARRTFWEPVAKGKQSMNQFFLNWTKYTPTPDIATKDPFVPNSPGYYIAHWDHLASTIPGRYLTIYSKPFKAWFVLFMYLQFEWLNSVNSNTTMTKWMNYQGSPEHPFNIMNFHVPVGGFKTFNQFFLRHAKNRPIAGLGDASIIVSPNDGGTFYLTKGHKKDVSYGLKGKSYDRFDVKDAFGEYGEKFVGGPLLDSLLWFTDYHYFFAPVSGKVVSVKDYPGSYNYDFEDFDPNDPYVEGPPNNSDEAGWYKRLPTHRRLNWIIQTKDLGYVGMSAIGFWGVGSIENIIQENTYIEKGQYLGHFNYGGSSIVLAFEPNYDIDFGTITDGEIIPLQYADNPTLIEAGAQIGTLTN